MTLWMGVPAVPELDFSALRSQLEADADQPSFETIRARRQRRTLRLGIAATVAATLIVLGGGAAVLGGTRQSTPVPIGPPSVGPTASAPASTGPGATGPNATVEAFTASSAGSLYTITGRCGGDCGAASTTVFALLHSTDLGATWATITTLDWVSIGNGPPVLLAADDTNLWVGAGSIVGVSTDGGRHWQHQDLGTAPTGQLRGTIAGGAAWFGWQGQVLRAAAGRLPAATAALPAGVTGVNRVTAISATRAVVQAGSGDIDTWYETTDAGAHWTKLADPCAGTRSGDGSPWTTLAAGPDGTRWVVCATAPSPQSGQPKDLLTSTDGGKTWTTRGALESSGDGVGMYPMSATTAWRTGDQADLYRTTDAGTTWSDVATIGPSGGGAFFAAIDANTAIYYAAGAGTLTEYVTRDGGRTWTTHPAPGG